MVDENYVGIVYSDQRYYTPHSEAAWFRPSENYPELEDGSFLSKDNGIYKAVREAFHMMEMDPGNYSTAEWNPLGDLIKPGQSVLIKPNLVMDYNQSGGGTDCLITNPQVVAPVIDYVIKALKGQGQIVIGDAPMQECIFSKLLTESGYMDLLDYYKKHTDIKIKMVDFRGLVTKIKGGGRKGVRQQTVRPNAAGMVINLGEESAFYRYDQKHLENMRITNYAPDRLKSHHHGRIHEYYVSQYVLDADVVINMPKPKTHRKAGYTAAMKNMVGINVRKEYLPHHTMGAQKDGGDEYLYRSCLRRLDARLYDVKNTCEGKEQFFRAKLLWYLAGGMKVLCNKIYKDDGEGSWYGNETISKTIVDLNKILNYVNRQGVLCGQKQREVLHIGDMIISGEKEGPVAPSPKTVGAVVISSNAYAFDYTVGTMMGAKVKELPFIKDTKSGKEKHSLLPKGNIKVLSNRPSIHNMEPDCIRNEDKWKFVATRGWKVRFIVSDEE